MKPIVNSCLALCSVLLPLGAFAQTDQIASTHQLGAASLAVLTPTAAGEAVAPGRASRAYSGTILNEKGMPLAGALVTIGPEKDQLAVTNAEGRYMVHSRAAVPLLRVTYAGYEEATLSLSNPQPVTFNLEPIDDYKRQLRKQTKAAEKAFYK